MSKKIDKIKRLFTSPEWEREFDEREQKEIDFCCEYVDSYNHGTDGHNMRTIIAKMATLLDMSEDGLLATQEDANVTQVVSIGKVLGGIEVDNHIVGNTLYLKNGRFISFPGGARLAHEILDNVGK
jgi:hypothetical protein